MTTGEQTLSSIGSRLSSGSLEGDDYDEDDDEDDDGDDEDKEDKKLVKISNLDRILVSARNDLHGVQALERAQLGEDLPHRDRLGEVEDYVALSWAYIIIVIVTIAISIIFVYIVYHSFGHNAKILNEK